MRRRGQSATFEAKVSRHCRFSSRTTGTQAKSPTEQRELGGAGLLCERSAILWSRQDRGMSPECAGFRVVWGHWR